MNNFIKIFDHIITFIILFGIILEGEKKRKKRRIEEFEISEDWKLKKELGHVEDKKKMENLENWEIGKLKNWKWNNLYVEHVSIIISYCPNYHYAYIQLR